MILHPGTCIVTPDKMARIDHQLAFSARIDIISSTIHDDALRFDTA